MIEEINGVTYEVVFTGCSPISYGGGQWNYPAVFEKTGTGGNLKKFYTGVEMKTIDDDGSEDYYYFLDGGVYTSREQAMEAFGY